MDRKNKIKAIELDWHDNPRWNNIKRPYSAKEVVNLGGSLDIEYAYAHRGALKLWDLVNGNAKKGYVNCIGALSGGQALQQAKAGIEAVYLSGWQVAADANTSDTMYPDQSLYAYNSVPTIVKRINNTFKRADEIQYAKGIESGDKDFIDFFLPIVADAEAGFGGVLNTFELTKNMIVSGAAAVHFEDQLSSAKKCGHMGGKVLVPTSEAIQKLIAARLASDVMGVPTIILARTDSEAAKLLTSDIDDNDKPYLTGERTGEGFFVVKNGLEQAISRGLAYAPYADLIWCETGKPDIGFAKEFSKAIKEKYPNQLLAYNCSPSFNWRKNLTESEIASFQQEIANLGFTYQFITLAGIHSMWYNMFDLAHAYARGEGMKHYVEKVQNPEFQAADKGYTFVAHQQEVGAGYFDEVTTTIQGSQSSVSALKGSTEEEQF